MNRISTPRLNRISTFLGAAGALGADLLAPPRCAACDARVRRLSAFCPACAMTVERAPAAPDDDGLLLFAPYAYGGAIARAIGRMKYERRPDLARPLGDLLAATLVPHASVLAALGGVLVVPVPLHPSRLAARGYNQSALLARRVAAALSLRCLPRALERTRPAPAQVALDRAARMQNLVGAVRAREPQRLRGRATLLVDDVRTTGATLEACTQALLAAGAARVRHAVVARVPGALCFEGAP